jgi:hypothetical protein
MADSDFMNGKPPIVRPEALLAFDLLDPMAEVCDDCRTLIRNHHWMGWSFVTFDGKIVCNNCRTDRLKKEFDF